MGITSLSLRQQLDSMQPPGPHVSVIIPTYNRARFIGDAVASCLAQRLPVHPPEILVVDDGSTDDTAAVLKEFGGTIRYIPLASNHGRNAARNVGLASATGSYVKFLDSDDVLEAGSLEIELATAHDSGADIVVSGWQTVEVVPGRSVRLLERFEPPTMEPIIDSLLAGKAVPTSAAIYSRDLVGDLRWDEELQKLDDWDWFIRAALRARKIARAPVVAYSWRQHPAQGIRSDTMLRNAQEHHAILDKLEKSLRASGMLTGARQKRLAQYYYKEMRILSLYDESRFDWGVRHIYVLDPMFVPRDEERQWWMRLMCRFLGVRGALSLHSAVKKIIKGSSEDRSRA
jgi:hypothetical protein